MTVHEAAAEHSARLHTLRDEIAAHLETGIAPFWLARGLDPMGGYLTCFDERGEPSGDADKYIVTQTRLIWGFAALARAYPDQPAYLEAARHGAEFFLTHFWDAEHGGWAWKTDRAGSVLDNGKVVYGQSFAIYALSEYALASGDPRALERAETTFDLLARCAADTRHGGYFENFEPDWQRSEPGFAGGDRKSLDVHMHLLEAFTTLTEASGREIHRRRLAEVRDLILAHMIDPHSGAGRNQFDAAFRPIPARTIRRTWNAERAAGEVVAQPLDTTSYGHNLELAWLLSRAGEVLGEPPPTAVLDRMTEHALHFGVDADYGGVYRDGPHHGPALVRDKEWWQNAEALVGLLDAYERRGDEGTLSAFEGIWRFARAHFIHPALGEWRQLLTREGAPLVADLGNPWKAIYHTGRAMLECRARLDRLLTATSEGA